MNANEIIIPCRLSYAHIWEPKQVNGTGDPKYSCCLLIKKSDTAAVAKIRAGIEAIKKDPKALAKWGGKLPPEKSFKSPLRDGDEEKDDENYAGCWFLNANANENRRPRIIDRACNEVLDQDEVYSGCYAKVINLLEIFDGDMPVIFYLEDTKQKLAAPRRLYTSGHPLFFQELKRVVGACNVATK